MAYSYKEMNDRKGVGQQCSKRHKFIMYLDSKLIRVPAGAEILFRRHYKFIL